MVTAMDSETIKAVARLTWLRAERSTEVSTGDGMSRLGARRALTQLARDLEATAAEIDRTSRTRKTR